MQIIRAEEKHFPIIQHGQLAELDATFAVLGRGGADDLHRAFDGVLIQCPGGLRRKKRDGKHREQKAEDRLHEKVRLG